MVRKQKPALYIDESNVFVRWQTQYYMKTLGETLDKENILDNLLRKYNCCKLRFFTVSSVTYVTHTSYCPPGQVAWHEYQGENYWISVGAKSKWDHNQCDLII